MKMQSVMLSNENVSNRSAVILLAAGKSSRMGKPKQLLEYNGVGLLSHMINVITACKADVVIVVLGANAEGLEKEVDNNKVVKVKNNDWQEGMASSIRCGLNALLAIEPSCDSVLFLTCDQPYVSASLLNDLINVHREMMKPIVACSYANTIGIPALFHKSMFAELKELKGDTGAKKIIVTHKDIAEVVPFPLGSIDIDTIDDYKTLNETIFKSDLNDH